MLESVCQNAEVAVKKQMHITQPYLGDVVHPSYVIVVFAPGGLLMCLPLYFCHTLPEFTEGCQSHVVLEIDSAYVFSHCII